MWTMINLFVTIVALISNIGSAYFIPKESWGFLIGNIAISWCLGAYIGTLVAELLEKRRERF